MNHYLKHERFERYAHHVPGHVPYLLRVAGQDPWSIPTEDELDVHALQVPSLEPFGQSLYGIDNDFWHVTGATQRDRAYWDANRGKLRFSAAAATIHFLHSTTALVRRQLRKVVVHEDRMSVNHPASHVRGLIPFCEENPDLRIERRVDLWRNCFMSSSTRYLRVPEEPERWLHHTHHFDDDFASVPADIITRPVVE